MLKILNSVLILVAVFMGLKQGWAMFSGKPEMMKMNTIIFFVAWTMSIHACGQKINKKSTTIQTTKTDMMQLTNPVVKKAIDALQENNKQLWFSLFTPDVVFTDDGNTLDFKSFFDNAFNKKEKFLSIDTIENEGKHIYGNFYAGQWGTFKVFFKFNITNEGKINRLDIGQSR